MSGTGIAGAVDYKPAAGAYTPSPCFVCGGAIDEYPFAVRVSELWGQLRACSAACRDSDRFRLGVNVAMRNQYRGTCYRCGETVEPGEGHFEKRRHGRWATHHATCAIAYHGTDTGPGAARPVSTADATRIRDARAA